MGGNNSSIDDAKFYCNYKKNIVKPQIPPPIYDETLQIKADALRNTINARLFEPLSQPLIFKLNRF